MVYMKAQLPISSLVYVAVLVEKFAATSVSCVKEYSVTRTDNHRNNPQEAVNIDGL
jgi:hypothetical protein